METTNPQNDLINLRRRLLDLQKTQQLTPESFGLYQQTILQLHQECERRKQTCFAQAEQLKMQASSAESQGHAFSAMASILYSVVNGYIVLEERRATEEQERAREQAAATPKAKKGRPAKAPKFSASGAAVEDPKGPASVVANGDNTD